MNIAVIKIGNSRGIRIPKTVIEKLSIEDQVEMDVKDNEIVIKPIRRTPREGWQDAFEAIHHRGEDDLLIDEALETDDFEWDW